MSDGAALPLAHTAEGTVYLVLDCQADRQTLVADLFSGQYRHPLRVVTLRARSSDHELPAVVREFVERAGW
jgi:hypothetical protein